MSKTISEMVSTVDASDVVWFELTESNEFGRDYLECGYRLTGRTKIVSRTYHPLHGHETHHMHYGA